MVFVIFVETPLPPVLPEVTDQKQSYTPESNITREPSFNRKMMEAVVMCTHYIAYQPSTCLPCLHLALRLYMNIINLIIFLQC